MKAFCTIDGVRHELPCDGEEFTNTTGHDIPAGTPIHFQESVDVIESPDIVDRLELHAQDLRDWLSDIGPMIPTNPGLCLDAANEIRRLRERSVDVCGLLNAIDLVIQDYDIAAGEKYDELCWQRFDGVEPIRNAARLAAERQPEKSVEVSVDVSEFTSIHTATDEEAELARLLAIIDATCPRYDSQPHYGKSIPKPNRSED